MSLVDQEEMHFRLYVALGGLNIYTNGDPGKNCIQTFKDTNIVNSVVVRAWDVCSCPDSRCDNVFTSFLSSKTRSRPSYIYLSTTIFNGY